MAVRFTEEQRACVERLAGPLDISAGAGSGKTFTLTQRIAAALADPSSGVDDIDQICAITFTRKAAAELKGRVRSTLRAQGRLDQAMKVDGAWISTIHGMCSRILRAEALQVGVDPGFSVLEGKERDDLLAQALSEVLGRQSDIVDGAVRQTLLREFPVRSFRGEASVASIVEALVNAAAAMPEGFDGFVRGPEPAQPSALAREMLEAYRAVEPFYRDCKPSKTRDSALADLEKACEALEEFVASGSQDLSEVLGILDGCPLLRKIKSSDDARNEAFDTYQAAHSRVAQNAAYARGAQLLDEFMGMARRVDDVFSRLKRAAAALDNNDLVRLTLRALEDPAIGARYADRFRLVMVDEFQDTDALQIAIVRHLAGPGLRYLCTVGDAQQSIYRFRGADVNGYRAFRAQLCEPSIAEAGGQPALLQLTRNFRSHGDILAFVRKVCAQPCVFGDAFLDLFAVYDGSKYRASEPRVQLTVTALPAGRAKAGEAARARAASASQVAEHFSRLREAGHDASEMVLLLGGMTHAQEYAAALRREGFECIVAGGSTFFLFPEVSVMRALACAVANPEDTASLFEVLTSEMFRLSADDLLRMATGWDDAWGIPRNRKLDRGLVALARARSGEGAAEGEALEPVSQLAVPEPQTSDPLSPALRQAVEVLSKALETVRFVGLSAALRQALVDSGWLARLQQRGAEGAACIANVLKAVRLVEGFEDGGAAGPSSAAGRFSALFDAGAKDKPGVLNAEGGRAVRIMTIHASKGLEFPLVAVAELPTGAARTGALALESRAGRTCAGLKPGAGTLTAGSNLTKAFSKAPVTGGEDGPLTWDDALAAPDAAAFNGALHDIASFEEASEGQRLFYVAATRAKESVAVFLTIRPKKDDPVCAGVADDIRSAFFGQEPFPEDDCELDYGGSAPALYRCRGIGDEGLAEEAGDASEEKAQAVPAATQPSEMLAPEVASFALPPCTTPGHPATGLFSYSSLHATLDGASDEADAAVKDDSSADEGASLDASASEAYSAAHSAALAILFAAPDGEGGPPASSMAGKDADTATDFGSAFHRLAQLAALRGADAARAHVDAACRAYGVADSDRVRAALGRWLGSRVCARAASFAHREPELPFALPVADGVLEGEIDLFCHNEPASGHAFIVDYKTGGSAAETDERLHAKHLLQGQCYALAALSAGFDAVEVTFVRVERDDPAGVDTLQQVGYAYSAADAPGLAAEIARLRANSTLPTQ